MTNEVPESENDIRLRGVHVHNLKHVDLNLPRGRLIVICGVSGSGKTSLAIDTLYAEGQRRYAESLSARSRGFLERLEKPAADRLEGIPPTIAVTGEERAQSRRATVASVTEIGAYLRLLYSRVGRLFCPQCERPIERHDPRSIAAALPRELAGARLLIAFRVASEENLAATLARFRQEGFSRAIVGDRMIELAGEGLAKDAGQSPDGASLSPNDLFVIVDRLTIGQTKSSRLLESLETALRHGEGRLEVFIDAADGPEGSEFTLEGRVGRRLRYSSFLECLACGVELCEPSPHLFDFDSPLGACPQCNGDGIEPSADGRGKSRSKRSSGGGNRKSVAPERICCACGGGRLCPAALAARVDGRNIAQVLDLSASGALEFLGLQAQNPLTRKAAGDVIARLESRLRSLVDLGLGHLSLDRPTRSLSSGEARRVGLSIALGSSLVNALYVLDEPTAGLHPADVPRLLARLRELRSRGNTVVVVEHDPSLAQAADLVVEIGPAAGERGGEIVFRGTPARLVEQVGSPTGDYLAGRRLILPPTNRRAGAGRIRLVGARGHNLRNVNVDFPLGVLCVVTGVSGAGKSTLIEQTLYPALCRKLDKPAPDPLPHDSLSGVEQIADVILVNRRPLPRSERANPATHVKAFDEIRSAFAETAEARTRGLDAGKFSFNLTGGRCERCEGLGSLTIDMRFLPDVSIPCPDCGGRRFRREILEVTLRGKNIAEVLEMTTREAFSFFRGKPKAQLALKRLIDVGLDYPRLGQAANTLSGGEAQRLKLASYMSAIRRDRTLFLMDEPTIGLHAADLKSLLDCFEALLLGGHSLVVIEHEPLLIQAADHVIDLGPGAGAEGGTIVGTGTPEEITTLPNSVTGRFSLPPA